MTHFARCKEARELLNLTQTQVANAIDMPQKEISRIENGKRAEIPYRYIQYLYEKGIDLNWLFSGEGAPVRLPKSGLSQAAEPQAQYLSKKVQDLQTRNEALLDAIRQLGLRVAPPNGNKKSKTK